MPEPGRDGKNNEIKSAPLRGLFILAVFYTVYLARAVLLPVTLALLLTFLLRPVVRVLKKFKIPEWAGAALVLAFFLAVAGYGVVQLSDPARQWIDRAPESMRQIGKKLRELGKPVQEARKTAEELRKMAGEGKKPGVEVKTRPGLAETFLAGMQEFIAKGMVMIVLLFFLLASGDLFIKKLMKLFPRYEEKLKVTEIAHEVEMSISRYLVTITVINIVEGMAVGAGMYLIGMPNPFLWGVMAGLLVYIQYLGPLVGISIVTVVAVLTFDILGKALLAPAIYLSIEVLQGQIITPVILGARFSMNRVAIFVWLIFWGWLWGIVGALIAVPLLAVFKIFCDHIKPLRGLGEFLGE